MNHQRKIFIKGGLFVKIIILVSLLITFIVSVNTVLSIRSKTGILMKGLIEKNKLFVLLLSASTKSAFRSADWYSVEQMVKKSVESEEIIYCRVVKPDGEIFLADDRTLYGKKIDDTRLLDTKELLVIDALLPQTGEKVKQIINPIEIGGHRWSVWIAVSLRSINQVKMNILYRNLMEGIMVILMGGLITLWLSRNITKPIAQLVEGTKQVSSGNLEHQIDIVAHDEIGKLANAFNHMTGELKKSRDELEGYSKTLEERVEERTKELQYEINDRKQAEKQLTASLKEKELLLQEIHHRVKNNMQVISSLLKLQAATIEEETLRSAFRDSEHRVRAMSLVHEKLYQSKDFTHVPFRDYLTSLIRYLYQSYTPKAGTIELVTEIEDLPLTITHAIPCGLIVNELLSNALKHAFPGERTGTITLSLHSPEPHTYELTVSDDGIGIPDEIDPKTTKTLGLHLVSILVEDQLKGEIEVEREGGTRVRIRFKVH